MNCKLECKGGCAHVRFEKTGTCRAARGVCFSCEPLEARVLLSSALEWTPGTALPAGRGDAAVLPSGWGVLVLGGTTSTGSTNTALELDWTTNSWVTAQTLDQPVAGAGVGETFNNGPLINTPQGLQYKYASDIFLYGGSTQNGATAASFNYSPSLDGELISATPLNTARAHFAYATDPATGDLYAIGGLNASGQALVSAEEYDPVADTWTALAPLPQPVAGATAASDHAGHIFVFGGDAADGSMLDTVYRYTIATDTWDRLGPMPAAMDASSAVYAAYGLIYLIGGRTSAGAVADVNVYDPVVDSWDTENALPAAEYGGAAAIDLNGNIQVIGGFNSAGQPLADVWTSPVGPAPVGIPANPTLSLGIPRYVYNGQPQPLEPMAVGSDGVTPVDGTFTVTYDGSPTPPTNAGTYNVIAVFSSADPNYVSSAIKGTLTISPAAPKLTVSGGGTITYDGQPHPVSATVAGIDGATPVRGTFAITYNGSSTPPTTWGTYAVSVTFNSSDPNYANATATTTITIPDPRIPTGVTAVGVSTTASEIYWTPVIEPDGSTPTYNLYEGFVYHSPRGSGGGVNWLAVATGLSSTAVIVTRAAGYKVTSVSGSGVESAKSAQVNAVFLSAPYLYTATLNGADVSSANVQVGGTIQIDLISTGNFPPTFSLVSGPSTISVNPTTGVVTYTPGPGEAGTVRATFQAANSVGSSQLTFTFSVLPIPTQIYATAASAAITLKLDTDQQHIDWTISAVSAQMSINDPAGLTIQSNGGSDTITLDYSNGDPLPATMHLNGTFTLDGLPSGGATDPLAGHLIELGTSTLYISYAAGSSPLAQVVQYVRNGYGSGAWRGATDAITTAAALAGYAIGYADSADGTGAVSFANTIELKYTLVGDANLDGKVTTADFMALTRNFGQTAGWTSGDFNYDDTVGLSDLLALSRNFGKAVPAPVAPASSATSRASIASADPLRRTRRV